MMRGKGQRYVLELRGIGVDIEKLSEDGLSMPVDALDGIQVLTSADAIYMRYRAAFIPPRTPVQEIHNTAVWHWPLPVFAAQPPAAPGARSSAGQEVASIIRGRTDDLYTAFWVNDVNDTDASVLIDKLFAFFDRHPEVPQALVICTDGDAVRAGTYSPARADGGEPRIPKKLQSVVTLLVSRTDRVDRFIRPYTIADDDDTATLSERASDVMKLSDFYAQEDRAYREALGTRYRSTTMSEGHWFSRLPEFLASIEGQRAKGFRPTNYLPIPWAGFQIEHFDEAPLVGYLHRPVTVRMSDKNDRPLATETQVAALAAGWDRALRTLPPGKVSTMILHDSSNDNGLGRMLYPLLKKLPSPLYINNPYVSFDVGTRLGDTGVVSPFVQIAFGMRFIYDFNDVAATIHRRKNGDVTFTMISPPDIESKAAQSFGRPFHSYKFEDHGIPE